MAIAFCPVFLCSKLDVSHFPHLFCNMAFQVEPLATHVLVECKSLQNPSS